MGEDKGRENWLKMGFWNIAGIRERDEELWKRIKE